MCVRVFLATCAEFIGTEREGKQGGRGEDCCVHPEMLPLSPRQRWTWAGDDFELYLGADSAAFPGGRDGKGKGKVGTWLTPRFLT